MANDFISAITEIMPLVMDGDKTKPFIITQDSERKAWLIFYPQPVENAKAALEGFKMSDPCALLFTGADFSKGSYPFTYDKVLCARLEAEYETGVASGRYDLSELKEMQAMFNFFEDRISEFSHSLTDYLTTVKNPLAEFAEMCPYEMATDNPDWYFNEDLAFNAVHYIENEVNARLQSYPQAEAKPELRTINGYPFVETQSVQIGKVSIILAECADATQPYLVCNQEGSEDYCRTEFPDYISAIREFTARQTSQVKTLVTERNNRLKHGVDSTVLTSAHCLPENDNADFTGKTLIIKASELSPMFRYSDNQLIVCSHGSGAHPGKNGRTVFGTELYSGEIVCYGRFQIEGVADEKLIPKWAKEKLETLRDKEISENKVLRNDSPAMQNSAVRRNQLTGEKKPTSLLGELNDAKTEAATYSSAPKDNQKKRGDKKTER